MKKFFSGIFIAALFVCTSLFVSAQHSLVKLWQTDSVFKVPESVLFDGHNTLYVSNIDGTDPWGKDGKGSVGKMNADGKGIVVEWVTGLNAPKGLGLHNGKLYVADLSEVVVIDIATAKIEKKIAIPNATGLNDISVGNDGVVYVSDSKNNQIYTIKNGVVEVYITGLKGANGVLMRGKDFYFLDAGGIYKLNSDKTKTKIADGMDASTDGVENIQGNDFIVSCWVGTIWYVSADGSKQLLKDTRPEKSNTADIGIDPKKKIIFVPTFFKNSVAAYEVK